MNEDDISKQIIIIINDLRLSLFVPDRVSTNDISRSELIDAQRITITMAGII